VVEFGSGTVERSCRRWCGGTELRARRRCGCAASGALKPSLGARAAAIPGRGRPSATHPHLRLGSCLHRQTWEMS